MPPAPYWRQPLSIIDFSARLRAKLEAEAFEQSRIDDLIVAKNLLVDAITQIRETVDDSDVVWMLRQALDVLES